MVDADAAGPRGEHPLGGSQQKSATGERKRPRSVSAC